MLEKTNKMEDEIKDFKSNKNHHETKVHITKKAIKENEDHVKLFKNIYFKINHLSDLIRNHQKASIPEIE